MGERNAPHIALLSRNSMFCLFTIASLLFIFSWFFELRSTGSPNFINNTLLPNSKLLAVFDSALKNPSDNTPYIVNSDAFKNVHQKTKLVKCDARKVKVFMYDLPPEFHFGLLGWKAEGKSVWPDIRTKIPRYPGGLNLQHSVEYWLTLDLLSTEFASNLDGHSAIRVRNSSEADVVFVPFFSCISYNRYSRLKPHEKDSNDKLLQEKLVKYVTAQEEWKKSGGRDHIIIAHHPNSLLDARMKLWPGMFILSDFGRYPPNIANVNKDLIAPYKHLIRSYVNDTSDINSRSTLLYFQGAIYRKDALQVRRTMEDKLIEEKMSVDKISQVETLLGTPSVNKNDLFVHGKRLRIPTMNNVLTLHSILALDRCDPYDVYHLQGGIIRQEIYYLLKEEKDVHFSFGSVQKDGITKATNGMHSSKFCLNIAGDTPSSNRLFDSIASHCVPVIISDDIELPYEDVLDYSEFCIFVRTSDALKEKFLINLIRNIGRDKWTRMWMRLQEIEHMFEYQYPSKEGDAVQMIWQAVARKVAAMRLKVHKSKRFSRPAEKNSTAIQLPRNLQY